MNTLDSNTRNDIKINLELKDLEKVFSLIINQKSHEEIFDELFKKISEQLQTKYNSLVIFNLKGEIEFFIFGNKYDAIKSEIDIELKINSQYIKKLLEINKKSFFLNKNKDKAFVNLFGLINYPNIIFIPCFFSDKLNAILFLAKDTLFLEEEINLLDQYAFLFGFSLTLLKTNEHNKELETRLNQSERLETIGKMASGMAHDFNNLLSSIFASINLLKRRPIDSESMKFVETIEDCSKRSRELTKGLLSYGKPTSRQNEDINPGKLIEEVRNAFIQTIPPGIKVNLNIEKNLFKVLGNSGQLHQVLMNLCVNAKEAIQNLGNISITAKNFFITEENKIQFPFLNTGNYISITVTDSGCGISDENLTKIFDPYFSTKNKDTDSGIGLYVSYGIIKAHNGHIEVTSKENVGTTFNIVLPAISQRKLFTEKTEKIILLADDEEMLQDLIAELLESHDYSVIKVQNGEEVLKILTEELMIDLLIIDYNMPGINGLNCVAELRKLNFSFPVLLSTGSLEVTANLDLEKSGVNKVLNKPYDFEALLEIVENLI
jgi:signal transduction histidine kinase